MSTFQEVINGDKPVIVDFFAEWCGPCKMMTPNLKKAKDALGDTAAIIKIDIDKNPQAAAAFNIQGVPTLLIFKKGQVQWRQSGVIPAQMLVEQIKKLL